MIKRILVFATLGLLTAATPAFAHDEMLLEDDRLERLVSFLGEECYTDIMVHKSWFGRVIIEAYRDDEQVREIVVDLKSGRFLRDRVDDWGRRSWRANHWHDWDDEGERSEHPRPPRDHDQRGARDHDDNDNNNKGNRMGRGAGRLGHGGPLHGRHPHKIALADSCAVESLPEDASEADSETVGTSVPASDEGAVQ